MPIEITMPRLSDTMESGTLLKWNVAEGDSVSSGDVVADVETDKATMELTVFDDGTMSQLVIDEGQTVEVGTVIALMAGDGEDSADAAPDATPAENVGRDTLSDPLDTPTPLTRAPDRDRHTSRTTRSPTPRARRVSHAVPPSLPRTTTTTASRWWFDVGRSSGRS